MGGPGGHYFDLKGNLIDIIESWFLSSLSNLSDLTKMFIFHQCNLPGCEQSDFLMKIDSFLVGGTSPDV